MASTGIINKQYVSSLDSFLDQREIDKLVTDIANEDNLTDILYIGDKKKPIETGQPFYNTYVNETLFKLLDTTGGTVNGTGTVSVNFTCTAATSGQTRKDDILMVPTNNASIIVTNVTTASGIDTVFAVSVAGTNITLTAGDKLSIFSVAVGENSVTQQNIRFGQTRYFNKYQIFREVSIVTDVQTAAKVETTYNGQPYFAVKDHIEKQILLKGKINAAFIGGDMSTTSFADQNPFLVDPNTSGSNGGGAIQTTRGLDKYIGLYGTTLVDGTPGTFQQANLNNAVQVLIASRSPKDQLVFGGSLTRVAIDTYFKALGSSGVQSVRLMVNGDTAGDLNLMVDKVSYGGFNFNYMTMPIQDEPVIFSQTNIDKSLYYIPYNQKVPVLGGGFQSCVGVRYIPSQTKLGNGMIDELHGGALAWNGMPTYQGDIMNATCSWTTKQGFESLGTSFFLKQVIL